MMVRRNSIVITTRELENIKRILHSKVFKNLKKHNMKLPKEDIDDIVSELLAWTFEKSSISISANTTNINKTPFFTFVSEKLISMFITSYVKHKYHEIPFTYILGVLGNDENNEESIIEHLMYVNIDSSVTNDIDDIVSEEDVQQIKRELDDFEITRMIDDFMEKLEKYKEKENDNIKKNNDSKFAVSKKLIKKYLYLLLKYGIDKAYDYKNTELSSGKKYRLEKILDLLSTLI
jgi:hypothetical protein